MQQPNHRKGYATGKLLSKLLNGLLRLQVPVVNWLTGKGLSVSFAKRLLTALNLFLIVGLLFFILPTWIMLIVAFFAIAAYAGIDIDIPPPKEPEWRSGWDGYGLYNDVGWRLDGSSEDDE